MRGETRKAIFNLHTDVLTALDEYTAQKMVSKNALVEQAILKELKEWRRQARRKAWQEGANDPLLLQDILELNCL
jgi:hypothetical protein